MISCVCMYHGRNWCLPEAVESYLRQTYRGPSELVIVNDCPDQRIDCDIDRRIKVYNLGKTIPDISTKQNICIELCSVGDWVAMWDDDDISLPHRLELLAGVAACYPDKKAFCSSRAWYVDEREIINIAANRFAGSAFFERQHYLTSGGAEINRAPDASAWENMAKTGRAMELSHKPDEIPYIYRWGGTGVHDSEIKFQDAATHNGAFHNRVVSDRRFTSGTVQLVPSWNEDYAAKVAQALHEGRPVF